MEDEGHHWRQGSVSDGGVNEGMEVTEDEGQGMLLLSKQRVPHTEFHSAYHKWVGKETTSSMFSLEVNLGRRLVTSLTFLQHSSFQRRLLETRNYPRSLD